MTLRESSVRLFRPVALLAACSILTACANTRASMSETIADMPHWMGGLPEGTPPRRGTPEYDAWMKKRAEDAAAIKPAKDSTTK